MWRLIHLWLALVSGGFLLLAAITGTILSFEPIYEESHPFYVKNSDRLTIAELLENLDGAGYQDLLSISRDENGFVLVERLSSESQKIYINPFNGDHIGKPFAIPQIFNFCRSLHRSLFLGKFGRFIVGISSILLGFMCISGFMLTMLKQGGFKAYFDRVIPNDFFRDYHTRLGRLLILSIFLIASSATYLFLERFDFLLELTRKHHVQYESLTDHPKIEPVAFKVFQEHKLVELREITYPFVQDVEEFFKIKLKDRELLINQFTGEIISQVVYSTEKRFSQLSFAVHTGKGNAFWAGILGISSLGILFFIYSGLAIYGKRDRSKPINPFSSSICTDIVLFGSEHGNTKKFAEHFQRQMLNMNIKCYLNEMNSLDNFPRMKRLIIITSTYGAGDPPTNASGFIKQLKKQSKQLNTFEFSVIGFGSIRYPDFCGFAQKVYQQLSGLACATPITQLYKVDNGTITEYASWIKELNRKTGLKLKVPEAITLEQRHLANLKVLEKIDSENKPKDRTILLNFSHDLSKPEVVQSGDLLVINPGERNKERFYSLSILSNQTALISVKVHEYGQVSNYLNNLNAGEKIQVAFQHNGNFHFPTNSCQVVMIANGTGLGPFLGMIDNNAEKKPISLFWGGQNQASLSMYQSFLDGSIKDKKLSAYHTAFSRAKKSQYVQDIIATEHESLRKAFQDHAAFLICGSLNMRDPVLRELDIIYKRYFQQPLEIYEKKGLILTDCY